MTELPPVTGFWSAKVATHIAGVTKPGQVSAVVADTIKKLECLPKGWLQ